MASKFPSNTSITIDGVVVWAYAATAGFSAIMDGTNMPQIGTLATTMEFTVDVHDTHLIQFTTVKKLYDLCILPTHDKVKQMSIHFWADEAHEHVIAHLSFMGWISSWVVSSGGGTNHVLSFTVQPKLENGQFIKVDLGN